MSSYYRLTRLAHDDLGSIAAYGLEAWGQEPMAAYLMGLEKRFQLLADNPGLAPERPDIHPDVRAMRHRQHLVVYREADDAIEILAIPHVRMDMPRHMEA